MNKNDIELVITKKPSVLFVASEANPFAGTGGLADVIGSLPKAIAKNDEFDVRVIMPLYKDFNTLYRDKLQFLGNFNVPLSWRNQYAGVFTYTKDGVIYYFIDNEYYFKRNGLYGFYDDLERFAFFSKASLGLLEFLDFYPNVLHAHDWQTALSVIYLKTLYANNENYKNIKTLFTIHNIEYQGKFGFDVMGDVLGLGDEYTNVLRFDNAVNLLKGAIELSNKVSTVSPTYASELKYDFYSHGLSNIISDNSYKFTGILNGIDEILYNPSKDNCLFKNYSYKNLDGKKVCKTELQKMLGLPEVDVPVIAMISRLVSHKGLDLVKEVLDDILSKNVQFVVLGKGDSSYEDYFRYKEEEYRGKFRAVIAYNKDLSSKIYSGADVFLMPSKQEPCGLSQMIACKYGTIPVVRNTGGLADSIIPNSQGSKKANGYKFDNYNAYDMLYVIGESLYAYNNKEEWSKLQVQAMKTDFSWKKSAKSYEKIYRELL